MLRSRWQNTNTLMKQATGIHMAAFCLCSKMYGRKIEGRSLKMDLEPDRYRRSHCVLIQ